MKKAIKPAVLALLCFFSCTNFCYAQSDGSADNFADKLTENTVAVTETTAQQPELVAPVVEDTRQKKHETPTKIDLKAVIFDPNADLKEQAVEENREMTKIEEAEYNIHEALHGKVEAVSTKGVFADKMKMDFEKGPIESISPWIDYNGAMANSWAGETYKNTYYGINFADIGFNGKMRDNKTEFRLMFSPVRYIEGNTYFNSFFADNYVTRKIGKNNKILVGNTWVPFGMEGKESPLTIPYFARSQVSRTFSTSRALGTKIIGDYDLVDYNVGVYSSGRFFKDFFPGPEFAGWVNVKPLGKTDGRYGKLSLGGGMDAGNAQSHYAVYGTSLIYEYKRLKASLEYATADGSNGSTGFSSKRAEGYYGTLAYRITPRLQALVRYDKFDPDLDKGNNVKTEYTAGINYFIKGQALKLMLNYVYYTVENGTFGSRIMAGTQIIL